MRTSTSVNVFSRHVNELLKLFQMANNPTFKVDLTYPKDSDSVELHVKVERAVDSMAIYDITVTGRFRMVSDRMSNTVYYDTVTSRHCRPTAGHFLTPAKHHYILTTFDENLAAMMSRYVVGKVEPEITTLEIAQQIIQSLTDTQEFKLSIEHNGIRLNGRLYVFGTRYAEYKTKQDNLPEGEVAPYRVKQANRIKLAAKPSIDTRSPAFMKEVESSSNKDMIIANLSSRVTILEERLLEIERKLLGVKFPRD